MVVLALTVLATALPRDILGLLPDDGLSLAPDLTYPTLPTSKTTTASSLEKPTSRAVSVQWPTPTSLTDSTVSTPVKTTLASTPSVLPASAESQTTVHSSKTWQIIGIAIISVLFVATAITCAMFFDHLCRFLKDVICCTSPPRVSEEFVPDSDCESQCRLSLPKEPSLYTRARELPWDTYSQQPSQRTLAI